MAIHPKVAAQGSTTVVAYAIVTLIINAMHLNIDIGTQQVLAGAIAAGLGLIAGYLKKSEPQFTSDNLVQHAQAVAAGVRAKDEQMKTAARILAQADSE